MKKSAAPNPDYINFNKKNQAEYLYYLHGLYEEYDENSHFNFSLEETFEKLYNENKLAYDILGISFKKFTDFVKQGYFYKSSRNRNVWYRKQKYYGQAYRKNTEHKKKAKELTDKQAWRIHKRIKKDKGKLHYRRGAGRWYKRSAAQRLRQYYRETLNNATKWDILIVGNEYKKFPAYDPWLWD